MRYPTGINKKFVSKTSYCNRGMSLEEDINLTNEYYLLNDKAIIYKKPTPITIVNVDYPSRYEAVIKEAYFRTPSTTDYNGIYKGKYIDFEAKQVQNKDYFSLKNIHQHQIDHLRRIINHGGIGFIIVRFIKQNKTFYLSATELLNYICTQQRKSIPISYFEEKGYLIKEGYLIRLDYLKILDIIYFGGDNNEKKY